jgi:polar amino acid transport system ATP-binding protein
MQPDKAPMVRMTAVQKRYGGLEVLRGIDLEVAAGETLSVIGPSGSGKSTMLRVLMTLDRPDAGSIEIYGESLWTSGASAARSAWCSSTSTFSRT